MTASKLIPFFPTFSDVDGSPLDDGYIYVGTAGLDAEASPINVYFDEALASPASQPIRTKNGYPVNGSNPAALFMAESEYSVKIKNKNGSLVNSILTESNEAAAASAGLANQVDITKGAALVGYIQRTVYDRLQEMPSFFDYCTDAQREDIVNRTMALDHSSAFVAAHAALSDGSWLYFPPGLYHMTVTNSKLQLQGSGDQTTFISSNNQAPALRLARHTFYTDWNFYGIKDLVIAGDRTSAIVYKDGIAFEDPFDPNDQYAGRWFFDNVVFDNCRRCVDKPRGNIGNMWFRCTFNGCDYHYFCKDNTSGGDIMHIGADQFYFCHFLGSSLACFYFNDSTDGVGSNRFHGCIAEGNAGFVLFVENYGLGSKSYVPPVFEGVWMEQNATAGSVTIEGTPYTPRYIYLKDCKPFIIKDSNVASIELVNSICKLENCRTDNASGFLDVIVDDDSYIVSEGLIASSPTSQNLLITDVTAALQSGINDQFVARTLPRTNIQKYDAGVWIGGEDFSRAQLYAFPGSSTINALSVADGVLFDACAEITVAGGQHTHATFTPTGGKYLVWSIDLKKISGAISQVTIGFNYNLGSCTFTETGLWNTYAGIEQLAASPGSIAIYLNGQTGTIRLSAFQAVQFDTLHAAMEYLRRRIYMLPSALPRTIYGTGAPTSSTWAVGDKTINTNPAVDGNNMVLDHWLCTVAGTPGTWVPQYFSTVTPAT